MWSVPGLAESRPAARAVSSGAGRRLVLKLAGMKPRDPALQERMARLGLRDADLRLVCTRSSGPGGQHVNKTDSCATITHLPTGLSATASDSRSQFTNKQLALERLVEALEKQRAMKRQEQKAAISKARRQKAKRSRSTKRKLVEEKRRRGETKQLRSRIR
jgi:protein subunit release factor B